MISSSYPSTPRERDRWILEKRGARSAVDPWRPNGFFVEDERTETGTIAKAATILLSNRECPWRCLMCDLWRHTLEDATPLGAIPQQIDHALARLPPADVIKLYNSGSFFDTNAIPAADYEAIAARVHRFQRVVVECHPSLVNDSAVRFRDQVGKPLEVAMGLETVHPDILPRLNKRMTLDSFARAAERLAMAGINLRAFVLVKPPFMIEEQVVEWSLRSVSFAFDCGATTVSLIPTRLGNGALDALATGGEFAPPRLETIEAALDACIGTIRGRVFADLWDLEQFSQCPRCFPARLRRLSQMNLSQVRLPPVVCDCCQSHV